MRSRSRLQNDANPHQHVSTPNVFEQPAPTLDLIWNQKFRDRWKLSFSTKNLLDRAAEESYTYRGVNYLRSSHRRWITTSLGLTYAY